VAPGERLGLDDRGAGEKVLPRRFTGTSTPARSPPPEPRAAGCRTERFEHLDACDSSSATSSPALADTPLSSRIHDDVESLGPLAGDRASPEGSWRLGLKARQARASSRGSVLS
jgi:hypothetical protein